MTSKRNHKRKNHFDERPSKRIRLHKIQPEPLEAPEYPEIFTVTRLADGAADGAYEQRAFRTRPNSF